MVVQVTLLLPEITAVPYKACLFSVYYNSFLSFPALISTGNPTNEIINDGTVDSHGFFLSFTRDMLKCYN